MSTTGWQFNVFWQDSVGIGGQSAADAAAAAAGGGYGSSSDAPGGYGFGQSPANVGLASAQGLGGGGGVRGGTAPGTGGFGGGSAVGPSVGSGVGGGIGGVVGGAPTGGNAGGVAGGGGAGGGGGDVATLANQMLIGTLAHPNTANLSPTQIAQLILTPGFPTGMNPQTQNPINIAGTIGNQTHVPGESLIGLGAPAATPGPHPGQTKFGLRAGPLGLDAPSSPSPVNPTLANLVAQFFGLTGGMGSIGGSTLGGEPTMGFPAANPTIGVGGQPQGTPAPVGMGTGSIGSTGLGDTLGGLAASAALGGQDAIGQESQVSPAIANQIAPAIANNPQSLLSAIMSLVRAGPPLGSYASQGTPNPWGLG